MNHSVADTIRALCVKADAELADHGYRSFDMRRKIHLSPNRFLELVNETGTAALAPTLRFNGCDIVVDDDAYEPWLELSMPVVF